MIRFRNPGTQYTTQIQVFRELYATYGDCPSFSLDDMAETIATTKLMTAYGYAGTDALALSNTENSSLNSTLMNVKMYAEVFRLLGWITSATASSYPLEFTFIGRHAATSDDVLPLYEQCVLGINNPQEIMDVRYTEQVRFFKTALLSLDALDGIIYKHELCLGPMSITNDLDDALFFAMIENIRRLRGSYSRYEEAYERLCSNLGVKPTLPDNSTRLPIAFMKTCGWVDRVRTNKLYPPKTLECLVLTDHGRSVAEKIRQYKDLRLDEFITYPANIKMALIRLGVYSMLKRAGYDITPVIDVYNNDTAACRDILRGKELLFSPYQTLRHEEIDAALGIHNTAAQSTHRVRIERAERHAIGTNTFRLNKKADVPLSTDDEVSAFTSEIGAMREKGMSAEGIVDSIFNACKTHTQTGFYPFIAMLFRIMGFDCRASRPGDNGARWDAIIIDEEQSIPIEIKSPTEEQHLSLKAMRQAVENKVILLSRKTYPTQPETTTLAVGYYLPNNRAEVGALLHDFKVAYNIRVGVIDLKALLSIAVSIIIDGRTVDLEQFRRLEGFANVALRER